MIISNLQVLLYTIELLGQSSSYEVWTLKELHVYGAGHRVQRTRSGCLLGYPAAPELD